MKILNESAFKKINVLLICAALMVTCIGSAAALSSATQEQSGNLSVTSGVSYDMGQQQSAEVITGDGIINQDQQSSENVFVSPNGEVKIVTAGMSGFQSVDTPSTGDSTVDTLATDDSTVDTLATDDSTNGIDPKATPKTYVDTITPGDSADIHLSQEQTETSEGDIDQDQSAFLKVITTPNDRTIGIMRMQQK